MGITAQQVKTLREKTGVGMMDCKKALVECDGNEEAAVAYLREKGLAKAQKKAGRATSEGWIGYAATDDLSAATLVELKCETDFVAKNEKFQETLATIAQTLNAQQAATNAPVALTEEQAAPFAEGVNELITVLGENTQLGRFCKLALDGAGMIGHYIHANGKIGVLVAIETGSEESAGKDELKVMAKDIAMQIAAVNPACCTPEELPQDVIAKEKEIYLNQAKEEGKPEHIAEKIVTGRLNKYYKEVCLVEQPFIKDDSKAIKDLIKETAKALGDTVKITGFCRMALGEE
ncbi:translation elongation factor Ts [Desulfoplanes formicivorans]|uniref:Elongation factor Ts n=1 Tax=Desulfoplanes formicivorans TaxID=1592317 RepID=A0A194AED6_9BACT|nr:translation elongation factor Ts [Desulfoplanes formicivorans]GAU07565.1 elongation factor Ts [Desulfoplanes formicivorans]